MSREPGPGTFPPARLRAAAVAAVWGLAFALGTIATAVVAVAVAVSSPPRPDDGILSFEPVADAAIAAVIGLPVSAVVATVMAVIARRRVRPERWVRTTLRWFAVGLTVVLIGGAGAWAVKRYHDRATRERVSADLVGEWEEFSDGQLEAVVTFHGDGRCDETTPPDPASVREKRSGTYTVSADGRVLASSLLFPGRDHHIRFADRDHFTVWHRSWEYNSRQEYVRKAVP